MPESTQLPVHAQIQAPNPIEILWEKHRRSILLTAVLVVSAVGIGYALQYVHRKQASRLWGLVSVTSGMARGYAEDASAAKWLRELQENARFDWVQFYFFQAQSELVSALGEDLARATDQSLGEALATSHDTPGEPLLLWVLALRATGQQRWDEALTRLDQLETGHPRHFLCFANAHPPQYQLPGQTVKGSTKQESNRATEKPDLRPPQRGSMLSLLRERIAKEKAFRSAHVALYDPPVPDPKPIVVVKFSTEQTIKIAFYHDQAPEHVENFLAHARNNFYDEQKIDEVQRKGTQGTNQTEQLHFGLPSSRYDDRTTWTKTGSSSVQLDFEDNDLSHFAGMVAAAQDPDGKSSGERIWINASDAAAEFDGRRVVFGRIVEGMDVIEHICRRASFTTEEMRASGRGQLQQNIVIEDITIEDDPVPPVGDRQGSQTTPREPARGNGNGSSPVPPAPTDPPKDSP